MRRLKEDGSYWITEGEHLFLMHRILRPDVKGESHICVGEAIPRRDGFWEVKIAFRSDRLVNIDQILVGIADSPAVALEVLWEQRNTMHFGVYQ